MKDSWKRTLSIFVIAILLSLQIGSASATMPPAPYISPMLHFEKSDGGPDYIGYIIDCGSWRLEDLRISLYDFDRQLIETGLLSDYSYDPDFGHYLGFRDICGNNIVDGVDTFRIYGRSGVSSNWGVVLTYEKTGRTLTSSTISGNEFSLDKENEFNENDRRLMIRYVVLILMLINLLVILAVVYRIPGN